MSEPSPSPDNEVTWWIRSLAKGNDDAAIRLWEYCYPGLLSYSRRKLPGHLRRVLDEEDVALSAFKSFCLGAQGGRFPDLTGRDEFWKLLLCIAGRKAGAATRYQNREKRGGGRVRGESIFELEAGNASRTGGIEDASDPSPSPATMAQIADQTRQLFDMLYDDELRAVALLRVEGYSVAEIAERLDCGKRTVERRLHLIRKTWQEAFDSIDLNDP